MSRSKQVSRKKFMLLTTGGTIASVETENGRTPGINGETLIRQIDGLEQLCQVEIRPVCSIDSTDLTPKHWKLLVETIRDFYEDYDGFVISHGTDTMAYTAAALSVMIQGLNKPVILTGSQLPMEAAGTDAKQNLYDAFLYGIRSEARGVSVVFNGKVIDGLCARKWKTESFDAFVSINRPLLATIENGRVNTGDTVEVFRDAEISERMERRSSGINDNDRLGAKSGSKRTEEHEETEIRYQKRLFGEKSGKPEFYLEMEEDLCALKLTPGISRELVRQILMQTKGVLIEGFGLGGIPNYLEEVFEEVMPLRKEKGYLTVMETQALLEGTDLSVYEVGLRAKKELGMEESGRLTAEAVTACMMWQMAHPEKENILETCRTYLETFAHNV